MKKLRYISCTLLALVGYMGIAVSQTPVITVRCSNPETNCATQEYCVDVEFQSSLPDQEIFGVNVRFFYNDDVLELIDFRDFQGEYEPAAPDPPIIITSEDAGPELFNFDGPAEFINGAIQLSGNGPPIIVATDGWTKLFQMCFTVENLEMNLDTFCPAIVWDLEQDPANGGFLSGDDGVVITVVDPDPNNESLPCNENVVQYNWEYTGDGTPPFGQPADITCSNANCALPVASIVLKGIVEKDGHRLLWTVNDSDEVSGFYVHRSINRLDWEVLGYVDQTATDPEADMYSFLDTAPHTGYNYYRVEQIESSGNKHFSQILQLTGTGWANNQELRVFPNPVNADREVTLLFEGDTSSDITIYIYDLSGRLMFKSSYMEGSITLDVSSLNPGIYIVSARTGQGRLASKLMIPQTR